MNSANQDTSLSPRIRFVLVDTSHPGNVGAVARAMKTMCFDDLVLVSPRFADVLQHQDAIAFASGATDVLEKAKIVDSLEDAIGDCDFVAALSARLREYSPPILSPRELSSEVSNCNHAQVALLFGSERYGLPNHAVQIAQALINIPANPLYTSLNLAQAVQIIAYELFQASANINLRSTINSKGSLASAKQLEGMYQHLEESLIHIGFLDPNSPKKLMPRLKRLFSRTRIEHEEVNIIRGIANVLLKQKKQD